MLRLFIALAFSMIFSSNHLFAQQKDDSRIQYDELRRELTLLRMQFDSLRAVSQAGGGISEDGADALSERFEKRIRELENKIDAVSRSTASVVFNPRTTIFVNVAARADNNAVFNAAGIAKIDNRPFMRTVELDFRAPVDPYAEAVVILALEDEAGTGFAIDPEEAYGLIKRLPILETAPLGMKLKIGKFRAPLGVNNKLHMHDLPWTTRPLVISRFLGTEHGEFFESGFNPTGVDFDFFLPKFIPGATAEMNVDFLRAGELAFSEGAENKQPAYLAHLNLSWDWDNEHLLFLGGSGYLERGESPTSMMGFDLTYRWAPSERRTSRSFVAGGEVFIGKRTSVDTTGSEIVAKPYGWFAYTQYQLSYWLYIGARYDWLQEPTDETLTTKSLSAYASYYTTEFLRFRLGFESRQSDIPTQNNLNTIHFEVNFVFGSHPTEPYWVNR